MKAFNLITLGLAIIGAINWGAFALDYNMVTALTGGDATLTTLTYFIVAASGVWQIIPMIRAWFVGEVRAEANVASRR